MSKLDDVGSVTAEQASLIKEKLNILEEARSLQARLADVRGKLVTIDKKMIGAGFKIPALACW